MTNLSAMAAAAVAIATLALAPSARAANLTMGSRILVSENNQNFNISVFGGKATYDDSGRNTPVPLTNTFGDGKVLDYNFFHSPSESIVSYASGAAGRISDGTSAAGNINGSGENWSNVWTTTDPGVGFSTTKDFTNGGVPNTFARTANITGTIDISGLASGQVYVPHGTFVNQFNLTLTMTGAGQPDIVASDIQNSNLSNLNRGWITDFSFENAQGLYDTIEYSYTNTDTDGSRARFMGLILDGVAFVPEPSTLFLSVFGLMSLVACRRRRNR